MTNDTKEGCQAERQDDTGTERREPHPGTIGRTTGLTDGFRSHGSLSSPSVDMPSRAFRGCLPKRGSARRGRILLLPRL